MAGVAKDSYVSHGIVLKNVTSSPSYASFWGSRYGTAAYRPKLVVTHYSKPTTATSAAISPRYVSKSTDAKVTYAGITSTGLARVEFKALAYDDATAANGDVKLAYSSSRTIDSGASLPEMADRCYRIYVRGVNKAGTAGSGKSAGVVHIDSVAPKLGEISLSPSSEEKPGPASPLLTWKGISDAHFKEVSVSVDGAAYRKAGSETSGTYTIPKENFESTGLHTIKVKAEDKMGNSTEKTFENYYVCIDGPEVGSLKLRDSSGKNITSGSWTSDSDPKIIFSDLRDKTGDISSSGVTYALTKEGESPSDEDFTAPEDLVMEKDETGGYSGSFHMAEKDRDPAGGRYDVHVRFTGESGNYTQRSHGYYLDKNSPKGTITISSISGTSVSGALKDTIIVTGNITDRQDDEDQDCSGIEDSSIRVFSSKAEGEQQKAILYKDMSESTSRPLDTTKYANGTYVLKLHIQDKAGNTKTVTKEITIANPAGRPEVTAEKNGSKVKIAWSFNKNTELSGIQYRIGEDGEWKDISGEPSIKGEMETAEPSDEGSYTIYVRGVDKSGTAGEAGTVSYIVDSTDPEAQLTTFVQGVISGKASDAHLDDWSISIRDKSAADDTYEKVLSGSSKVDGSFGFIDLSDSKYKADSQYRLKLTVTDKAGNASTAYKDITRPADEDTAKLTEPSFRVSRPSGQSYKDEHFQIGTKTESLSIRKDDEKTLDEESLQWYVDGVKKAEGAVYSDDFSCAEGTSYETGKDYDILAAGTDEDGRTVYSRAVTINGEKKTLSMGDTSEKDVKLEGKAVALRIDAPETIGDKKVTYSISISGGKYTALSPGKKISVSDIDGAKIYGSDFTVKAESEADISSLRDISVTADVLAVEDFSISAAEDFRPVGFSLRHKLNYKTYFTWQTAAGSTQLPDDISFEVYRSTEDGFMPSEDTLAAGDFASCSYTEINTGYSGKYYYRVRAVQKDENDRIISSSGFSRQMYGKVADADEYLKRLGNREYWSYTSMGLPQGDANIEKSQGNFTYSQSDAEIPNEGVDVSFERTYNSQSSAMSSLGMGWSSSFDMEVLAIADTGGENDDSLVLRYGDGTLYQFTKTSGGNKENAGSNETAADDSGTMDAEAADDNETAEYISSLGKYVTLTKTHSEEDVELPARKKGIVTDDDKETVTVTSDYTVRDKEASEYRFNNFGSLVYITESNGNFAILEYAQDSGLLSRVRTNRNIAMELTYNDDEKGGDPLTIRSVKLPDGSSYEYDYAGSTDKENVRLTSVTHKAAGGDGEITYRYDYDGRQEPKLDTIRDVAGNRYTVDYDSEGRASQMSDPDGKTQKLTYSDDSSETKTETMIKKGLLSGMKTISSETDRFDGWFGNCLENIDAAGNRTGYTYRDNLLVMTEKTGQKQSVDASKNVVGTDITLTETTSYDSETDNVTKERSEDGTITKYSYDGDNVTHETTYNADGEKSSDTDYEYDDNDNETRSYDDVTDEEELSEYYEEDSETGLAGELKEEVSKEDGTEKSTTSYTYEYSDDGSKTETETEECDGVKTVTVTVTDAMGREKSTKMSVDGDVKSETVNTYDGFGRLTKTVVTQGDSRRTTSSTYDANGTVLTETDADGTVTSYTYDKLNRVKSRNVKKGDLSKTWTTDYDYEDVTLHTGSATKEITDAYTVTEKDPDGYITSQTFTDPSGNVVREKADGMYTDKQFDKSGRVTAAYEYGENSDGEGGVLTLSIYDENGNQTHTAVNPSVKDGTYNIGGDCIVTESRYDADGNVTASINGEGHRTSMSYDIEGQLRQVAQPGGAVTEFSYSKVASDGTSKVTTTDACGNKSSVTTNARGLEESITDYLGNGSAGIQRTFEYDGEGNVVKEKELEGNYKTYGYDATGRNNVVEYHKADGTATMKSEYTYDINDQVTLMKDFEKEDGSWKLSRSTKYTYDTLKRMSSYTEWDGEGSEPEEPTVSYTYDIDGNVTAIDYANTGSSLKGLTFEYSSSKKLTKIKAKTGGLLADTVREYEYDAQGRVSKIKDHYGFTGNGSYLEKSYTYDSFGRVTSMAYRGGSGHDELKEAYIYKYDRNNNITSERTVSDYDQSDDDLRRDITREYTYDTAGRLTETKEIDNNGAANDKVTEYEYDKVGNRLMESKDRFTVRYSYDSLNQLTARFDDSKGQLMTYGYDRNGNLVYEVDQTSSIGGRTRDYTYDVADRLKKLTVKVDDKLTMTQENRYNGNGQRISKEETKPVKGLDGETTETTKTDYYYQDGTVLYTKDADGNRSSMNLLGTSANVIATSRGTGDAENWYLYNKDIRESTTSIIDAKGSAAATYQYDDFGDTTITNGADFDNEICYTGQIYDKSSGLYYYNARYYDPENARFITQDTYRGEADQPDTLHLYAYCANNPINYTDPSGHVFTRTFNRMQCQNMYAQLVAIEWTWTAIEFVRGKLTSAYKLYSKLKRIKKHMKNVKKLEDQKKKIKALKSLLKQRKKTLAKKILSTGIGKVVEKIIKSPKWLYGKFKRGFQIGGWGYMRVIMSRKKIVKEKITKTKFKFYSVLDFRFYYSTESIKNFRE